MPMIDVKFPTGSLDADTRARLADRLTTNLLEWEKAPDNELTRSITWVYFHEAGFYVGGPQAASPHYHVLVTVPDGALSDRRKAGLIEEATEIVLEEAGIEGREFTDKVRVWVHLNEVPDGNWGSAGAVFRYRDIVAAVNGGVPQSAPAEA